MAYIVNEIHTVIVATVDDDGLPVTAAIDMMDNDETGLYFLTARGKGFYDRLTKRGFLALTGITGNTTMTRAAVSVRGKVRELGDERIPDLFRKNPYMHEIYPTEASRRALTVFYIYDGGGEYFDLSKKPIERAGFSFGAGGKKFESYFISAGCVGCRKCLPVCPQDCIRSGTLPFVIESSHCLRCGNCLEICPAGAVVKR